MPGSSPPPKKPPMYGRVGRAGVPVGHALAADRDLARIGLLAALDPLGVGLAGGHHARLAPRRRPLHLARRRAVARVEEARRRALGGSRPSRRARAEAIAKRPSSAALADAARGPRGCARGRRRPTRARRRRAPARSRPWPPGRRWASGCRGRARGSPRRAGRRRRARSSRTSSSSAASSRCRRRRRASTSPPPPSASAPSTISVPSPPPPPPLPPESPGSLPARTSPMRSTKSSRIASQALAALGLERRVGGLRRGPLGQVACCRRGTCGRPRPRRCPAPDALPSWRDRLVDRAARLRRRALRQHRDVHRPGVALR